MRQNRKIGHVRVAAFDFDMIYAALQAGSASITHTSDVVGITRVRRKPVAVSIARYSAGHLQGRRDFAGNVTVTKSDLANAVLEVIRAAAR